MAQDGRNDVLLAGSGGDARIDGLSCLNWIVSRDTTLGDPATAGWMNRFLSDFVI